MEMPNSFNEDSRARLLKHQEEDNHQSSSQRLLYTKKLTFFVSLIIVFTFIIGAIVSVFSILKRHVDSHSLSANPTRAVRDVCYYSFPYYHHFSSYYLPVDEDGHSDYDGAAAAAELEEMGPLDPVTCFESISALLHENQESEDSPRRISPSEIFLLSLQVSISQIKNLRNEPALEEDCAKLVSDSVSQLNRSLTLMGVDPGAAAADSSTILRDKNMINNTRSGIKNASNSLGACLDGLKKKKKRGINGTMGFEGNRKAVLEVNKARIYLGNSLGILENGDNIRDMFYPPIGSLLGSDFLLMTSDSFLSVALFCLQYLVLIFLFGVVLRLYRRY